MNRKENKKKFHVPPVRIELTTRALPLSYGGGADVKRNLTERTGKRTVGRGGPLKKKERICII